MKKLLFIMLLAFGLTTTTMAMSNENDPTDESANTHSEQMMEQSDAMNKSTWEKTQDWLSDAGDTSMEYVEKSSDWLKEQSAIFGKHAKAWYDEAFGNGDEDQMTSDDTMSEETSADAKDVDPVDQ